jgi:hypothetical protein
MTDRFRYTVVILLIFAILGVSGLASAQTVLHDSHHAHHQAATHGTALCSWLCAAGQIHDASVASFAHVIEVLTYREPVEFEYLIEECPAFLPTRSPPRALA